MKTITRFAPSPTGHLHLGGARTALFAWLQAKAADGKFLLRFEDTDQERSSSEFITSINDSLAWLGIEPDEPPIFQSKNLKNHKKIAFELLESGNAYSCDCSQERLEEVRKAQIAKKLKPKYDGLNRDKNLSHEEGNVIRFKMPQTGTTSFQDEILGNISVENKELDDFIILRSDASPTYNFCAAIDDREMNISTVIRGDDHITNTLKQINILNALDSTIPNYAHLPMVLSSGGKRLSKREGAIDINDYRKSGYLKEAMINYLMKLGWAFNGKEIFTKKELIKHFKISDVNSSAAKFSQELLDFYNNHYLREYEINALYKYMDNNFLLPDNFAKNSKKLEIIELLRESANNVPQIIEDLHFFVDSPTFDEELKASIKVDRDLMINFKEELNEVDFRDKLLIGVFLDNFLNKNNLKFPMLGKPLRLILTGRSKAPSITDLLFLIGKKDSVQRIDNYLEI